jgi:hypothetical protein
LILIFNIFITSKVFAAEINQEVVIELVNEARNKQNIQSLSENTKLNRAAEEKANDMLANNYFAHTSPSGVTPWDWIEKNNYDYKYAGENLAINFSDPTDQQEAWMNSPTHRKNILNTKYNEIGVAVVRGKINGHISTITVQEFGTLMNDKNISAASIQKIESQEAPKVLAANSINPENSAIVSFSEGKVILIFWTTGFISLIFLLTYEILNIIRKRHLAGEAVFDRVIK